MFCWRFLYSIPPNPTTHAAAITPIAIPAFFPPLIPPDEDLFSSSLFTLAEDRSPPSAVSGAGDKDGGGDVTGDGVEAGEGVRSDAGGGAGGEPAEGDGVGDGTTGKSSEPLCGAGDGESSAGSEETERVNRSVKANKEMNILNAIAADAACVVYEFVEEQMTNADLGLKTMDGIMEA